MDSNATINRREYDNEYPDTMKYQGWGMCENSFSIQAQIKLYEVNQ